MLKIKLKQTLAHFKLELKLDLPAHGISAIYGHSGAGNTQQVRSRTGRISGSNKGRYELRKQGTKLRNCLF